ncbi:TetR/AcrR family transcriptional regulator [Rathayibacter sp. CAU 1779]
MDLESKSPDSPSAAQGQRRRRGDELEAALLDAAWDELEQNGYAALTYDAVAQRAQTSRPVLYRRWPTRDDLVLAAITRHVTSRAPVEIRDTGSLRGDLIALMESASTRFTDMVSLVSVLFGGYYSSTGETIGQIRARLVDPRSSAVDILLDRARARGERVPRDLPARVKSLPFDLLRHELLMSLSAIAEGFVLSVVDEVFLPLLDDYARREDEVTAKKH